jgi:anti-anti-sigma factor
MVSRRGAGRRETAMSLGHSHQEQFTIGTDLSDQAAVLTVRGRLDIIAVPALSALFDMVVAGSFATVIVDVSGLDSITSECLALMAHSAERLAALDRRFVIRSPSVRIARLLDVSGLKDLVFGDSFGSNFGGLSPSESQVLARHPVDMGSPGQLAKLQMGSEFPSEDDVVDGALRMVVALAQATIAAADGVSVSLRRNGRLATVAASDQTILDMDTYQYATGEGPCLDASIEGRAFQTQSLIDERRWPAFTPSAHALGINAILSSPLRASKQPVGALNIYSRQPSAFASDDQKLASVFAIEASIILTEARVDVSAEDRAARFQSALLVRETIAQAQGVLMGREGISADDAFTLLRTHSQQTGQPLFERAQEIIASLRRPPRDRGTGTVGDPNG